MKTIFATAICALAITAPAAAQDIYLQADVAGDYYPSNSINDDGFDIGPGASLGGRIGTDLEILRAEIEINASAAVVDLQSDPGSDDFDYYSFAVVGGVYRDIELFYVGGGLGFVYQELSTEILGQELSESETNFVGHVEAGLNLYINDAVAFVPHYRSTWLPGFELDDEVFVHSLRLGVRFGL